MVRGTVYSLNVSKLPCLDSPSRALRSVLLTVVSCAQAKTVSPLRWRGLGVSLTTGSLRRERCGAEPVPEQGRRGSGGAQPALTSVLFTPPPQP